MAPKRDTHSSPRSRRLSTSNDSGYSTTSATSHEHHHHHHTASGSTTRSRSGDAMTRIKIETFSDLTCPFCYISKKNLDTAMDDFCSAHPDVEFENSWHPYYLSPWLKISGTSSSSSDAPPTASPMSRVSRLTPMDRAEKDKTAHFAAKYGASGTIELFQRFAAEGAPLGLEFNWTGKTGHSRDGHRLILEAQRRDQDAAPKPPRQRLPSKMLDALFSGSLEEGEDISDRKFLARAAVEEGLFEDDEEALEWLATAAMKSEADESNAAARDDVGITAVPSYVVNGRYRIGGKQAPDVFLRLFERIHSGDD